jgi:hypothetical protein
MRRRIAEAAVDVDTGSSKSARTSELEKAMKGVT